MENFRKLPKQNPQKALVTEYFFPVFQAFSPVDLIFYIHINT